MVDTIEDLLIHKEELYRKKEENLILKEQLEREQNLEHEIISRQLYLQPDFSREELIKTIYIPKNKFAPLFKQYAGMSFSKYINNLRLEYAAKMLKNHPDYTVDTIAQECGMSTQSLYRLFSGKYGVTPTDFQVGVQHINNKNITEDK